MFDIKYTRLKFKLELQEDCELPPCKTSALRGGMGRILLTFNCIGDKNCDKCNFYKKCIVKSIMSPHLEIKPPFMPTGATVSPFIIECFDERTNYYAGDVIEFNLIIFGEAIVYTTQFIYAFDALGNVGIASGNKKYKLIGAYNDKKFPLYENGCVYKENLSISTIKEYITTRKQQINTIESIRFVTPFRFVKKSELTHEVTFKDIVFSVYRRLIVLNYFENREVLYQIPNIEGKVDMVNSRWKDIKRYSSRQNKDMKFGGIIAKFEFSNEINNISDHVIACELLHIGKNTSFGLGKYIING